MIENYNARDLRRLALVSKGLGITSRYVTLLDKPRAPNFIKCVLAAQVGNPYVPCPGAARTRYISFP
jgi:hypothetical protein